MGNQTRNLPACSIVHHVAYQNDNVYESLVTIKVMILGGGFEYDSAATQQICSGNMGYGTEMAQHHF
jgi:hypothetical protein